MSRKLTVMGRTIALDYVEAARMYVVVKIRPVDLVTDAGTYCGFAIVECSTDDYARAVRVRRSVDADGLAVSVFIVRVEDSAVIL